MSYSSTRGQDNKINFVDAMLNGLAEDGGLYVPDKFPKFTKNELKELSTLSYSELAFEVTKEFIDSEEISSKEYKEICKKTYGRSFGKDLISYDKLNEDGFVPEYRNVRKAPTKNFKRFSKTIYGLVQGTIVQGR